MNAEFKTGDIVVEPTIGICNIEGVVQKTIDGKTDLYYLFNSNSTRVYIAKSKIIERGVRKPMTSEEIKKIINLLKVPVTPQRTDLRTQYLHYRDIMKSGDPVTICKLLRDLYILEQQDDLKGKEKEIMEQAMKFLVNEISYVKDASKSQVTEQIHDALKTMFKKKQQKDKITKKSTKKEEDQ
ncbi:hypothetical protein JXA32_12520 [Candidatus Sumerlaeota bacterium]|nr:hypothetical protein [Candidatus Sumerlaeota bacterium]